MINIERLPDELWLEIFSYILYLDIFRCFKGLNKRINSIISTKRIKLELKSDLNYKKSDLLLQEFPEYIIDLSIKYYNQNIDISPFKNILSLHISHPNLIQLIQIQSNYFKYLNQLNIVVCKDDFPLGNLLFNHNKLNYLTTCWFPTLDSYFQDDKIYQSHLTLNSLRLNYCHIQTFFKLLRFLPNLISFECALVSITNLNQLISYPLIDHLNLIRLKIFLRTNTPFFDLQTILLHVPCLEQFYLNIDKRDILADKLNCIALATIIENDLSNMKKCDIRINLFSKNLKINLHDLRNINYLYNQLNVDVSKIYFVTSSV